MFSTRTIGCDHLNRPSRRPVALPPILLAVLAALFAWSCSSGALWGRVPGVERKTNSFDATVSYYATNHVLPIEQEPSGVAFDLLWQPEKPERIRLLVQQHDSFRKVDGPSTLELRCQETIVTFPLFCGPNHVQDTWEDGLKTRRYAILCVQDFSLAEFHSSVSPILACSQDSPFRLHGDETGLFHPKARGLWNDLLILIHQRKDAHHDNL